MLGDVHWLGKGRLTAGAGGSDYLERGIYGSMIFLLCIVSSCLHIFVNVFII